MFVMSHITKKNNTKDLKDNIEQYSMRVLYPYRIHTKPYFQNYFSNLESYLLSVKF
ncbi:hypothetical protein NHP164001_11960 [Helicobacter trogontum]|uniref:Uncharacterized protein n=1 Tax=Helicobacter trogontum TaxID=50960 RepID=A0ABQ0D4A0_9HELI